MPEDDLAYDLDGNAGSGGVRGGMSSENVWPKLDPDQMPCLSDHCSCCRIGDGENLFLRLDSSLSNVALKRSHTFLGMKPSSSSLPLFGFWIVSF